MKAIVLPVDRESPNNHTNMGSPSAVADVELIAQKTTGEKRGRGESEDSIGVESAFFPIVPAESFKKPRPSCDIIKAKEGSPKTGINGRESVSNLPMGNLTLKETPVSR